MSGAFIYCQHTTVFQSCHIKVGGRERKVHRDPIQLGIELGTFYALTTEPLDPWQRSRSKSAYKSQARGLSRLQLSFFLSPSNTLPYCEWRSQVDRVVGLEWIDCTSTLPEQILSLSTTPASDSIISQCIVACSTISLEC